MDNFYDVLYADASVGGLADPAAEVRVSTSIITTTRGKQIKDILEKRLSPRGYRE